jgi:alpha-L-fucosidase
MSVSGPAAILGKLIDTVSKGGFYLLNISPMADGIIPDAQQKTLLEMGTWLDQNGEAIYNTHPWTKFGENGPGGRGAVGYHFTVKDGALYAIGSAWPGAQAQVASVTTAVGTVEKVGLLGGPDTLTFKEEATGLTVTLPPTQPGRYGFVLKITGLQAK